MIKPAIIKNAPPPPSGETRGRKTPQQPGFKWRLRYPFDEMEVGDAFDVPITQFFGNDNMRYPEHNRVSASAAGYHKRNPGGRRFIVRLIDNGRVCRCWRVA